MDQKRPWTGNLWALNSRGVAGAVGVEEDPELALAGPAECNGKIKIN